MVNTNFLKSKRILHQLSQKDIAKLIGITEQTYSLKENNKATFTLEEVNEIIAFLNLEEREVMSIFFNSQYDETE